MTAEVSTATCYRCNQPVALQVTGEPGSRFVCQECLKADGMLASHFEVTIMTNRAAGMVRLEFAIQGPAGPDRVVIEAPAGKALDIAATLRTAALKVLEGGPVAPPKSQMQ